MRCFARIAAAVAFLALYGVRAQQAPPGGYYTTRYDHLDIENILNQKRLVHYYAACLLDRGPCTPQGTEFKRILPEALKTNCMRCTEKQRFVTLKSIRRLKKEYPDVWQQLSDLWDPTGEYVRRLEEGSSKPQSIPSNDNSNNNNVIQPNLVPDENKNVIKNEPAPPASSAAVPLAVPQSVPQALPQVTSTVANKPLSFAQNSPAVIVSRFGEDVDDKQNEISSSPSIPSSTAPTTTKTTATTAKTSTQRFRVTPLGGLLNTFASAATTIKNRPIATNKVVLQERPTTTRILYNYDFGVTIRPLIISKLNATNGLDVVLKGVNNIIQPISNIAGRVITVGTDFAGLVLNALGVRKTIQ